MQMNMKEQTQYKIEVMQGFMDGHDIEARFRNRDDTWDIQRSPTAWNWDTLNYRIAKPKDDDWYYIKFKQDLEGRAILGKDIAEWSDKNGIVQILRPATPAEIEAAKPKELSLEDTQKVLQSCLKKIDEVSHELGILFEKNLEANK
jgi:hypothetical protein